MRLQRRRIGVHLLAHQRMAAQLRLQPDLVALARHQPDLDQRGAPQPLHDAVLAQRLLASGVARAGGALNQLVAIPDQVVAPAAGLRRQVAVHDRLIDALRLAPQELRLSGAPASRRPWRTSPGPRYRGRSDARPAGVAFPATAGAPRPVRPATRPGPAAPAARPAGPAACRRPAATRPRTRPPGRRPGACARARRGRFRAGPSTPGRHRHRRASRPHRRSPPHGRRRRPSRGRSPSVAFEREPSRSGAARNLSSRPPASAARHRPLLDRTRHHHRRGLRARHSALSPAPSTRHPAHGTRHPAPCTEATS